MNCDEDCAADKAEAKEFAYFSGLSAGAKAERHRVHETIKVYFCGDFECEKHVMNWKEFILALREPTE
jgi:hypothetical protein